MVRSVASANAVPGVLRTAVAPPPALGNAGIPAFGHVFVIVLENADFRQVTQAGTMPYLNRLIWSTNLPSTARAGRRT